MKTTDPAIQFQFSQVDFGLTVSIGVEVSATALAGAFVLEESFLRSGVELDDLCGSIQEELQGEVVKMLHQVSATLRLRLQQSAVAIYRAEIDSFESDPQGV